MDITSIETVAVLRTNKLYARLRASLDELNKALSDLAVEQARLERTKLDISIELRRLEHGITDKIIRYDRAGT